MNNNQEGRISRRGFMRYMLSAAAMPLLPGSMMPSGIDDLLEDRYLSFYNIHTDERLDVVYWSLGRYHIDALSRINHIMRDHRSGEIRSIEVGVLEILHTLRKMHGTERPFQIISGYRSPSTNHLLSSTSKWVSPTSLHMYGRAADVRLPGVRLTDLRDSALALGLGGVGYYPTSSFLHVDTGEVKFWKGR